MIVNKNLIWDYDWKEEQYESEEFKLWYIARVLSRGTANDVRNVGIPLKRISAKNHCSIENTGILGICIYTSYGCK